jgi:hypothetical protein
MPEDDPLPLSPRRRWPWWVGGGLLATTVLGIWQAPRITCAVIHHRSPWEAGDVVIRDARLGEGGYPTIAVATLDQTTFRMIAQEASQRWVPGFILADGMQVWGTFIKAPELSWRISLDDQQKIPAITARVPAPLADTLLTRLLGPRSSSLADLHLTTCTIQTSPGTGGKTTWALHVAGSATYVLGGHQIPVTIEALHATATSQLSRRPDGSQMLTASATITDLRGKVALVGAIAPLRIVLEKELNQRLGQDLPKALVPGWWPEATAIDLALAPSQVTEL